MKDLQSLLLMVGILWAAGVIFVAVCMGIVKFLVELEDTHD